MHDETCDEPTGHAAMPMEQVHDGYAVVSQQIAPAPGEHVVEAEKPRPQVQLPAVVSGALQPQVSQKHDELVAEG